MECLSRECEALLSGKDMTEGRCSKRAANSPEMQRGCVGLEQ